MPDLELASLVELPDVSLASDALATLLAPHGVFTLREAGRWVRALPYGRPSRPGDPSAVIRERRGTCSSKHALLATLAASAEVTNVRLCVGLYAMREDNTPGVGPVLAAAGLTSILEAHCYLLVDRVRLDLTGLPTGASPVWDALVRERCFAPASLAETKVVWHRAELKRWRVGRTDLPPEALWRVREDCIAALQSAARRS